MAATVTLSDNQIVDLVRQLDDEAKAKILRELLRSGPVEARVSRNESHLRELFSARGLDFDKMTPDEIEAVINEIADGQ